MLELKEKIAKNLGVIIILIILLLLYVQSYEKIYRKRFWHTRRNKYGT